MDTVFSENLVKAIEQGMAAAFERSTALCVNEMHRMFDRCTRRSEARRGEEDRNSGMVQSKSVRNYTSRVDEVIAPRGGFCGCRRGGFGNGGADSDLGAFDTITVSIHKHLPNYTSVTSNRPLSISVVSDEVGGAEFGIGVGKMTGKLESVGHVEMEVGIGGEAVDFVGVGGVVSEEKEAASLGNNKKDEFGGNVLAEEEYEDDDRNVRLQVLTKEISRSNTRFHGKAMDSDELKDDDTVVVLYSHVAVGTPVAISSRDIDKVKQYDFEDLRKTPNRFYAESDKKVDNGYSFVKTPSPALGVDDPLFITWGEIEGTPLRLEAEDTPIDFGESGNGPQFKIPMPHARKIRQRSQIFQKPPLHSPVRGGSASSSARTLSPAAQKFMGNAIVKSSHAIDESLRASVLRVMLEQRSLPSLDMLQMVFLHLVKASTGTYLACHILEEICCCLIIQVELRRPNIMIFNFVLAACVRFGPSLKGQQIMELMAVVGVAANVHTVVIVARIHEMNAAQEESIYTTQGQVAVLSSSKIRVLGTRLSKGGIIVMTPSEDGRESGNSVDKRGIG